jgi:ABC-type glycerol-3-phosphate transport system permease component
MVPPQVRFVPIYIMLAKVGLLNTYASLILPYATSALGTFLIREAFASISDHVLDAARIDGANVIQIIFRIMVPIAKPTIIAFSLISVVFQWNDYFWPLITLYSPQMRTMPVGMATLQGRYITHYGKMMAGALLIAIPSMLLFILVQRYYVRSIAQAGMKT